MPRTTTTDRKAPPRRHEVKADLANFELAKARSSLNLKIYAGGEKIGELEIGRGSLYWYGARRQRSKRIDWSKFAQMMDGLAYGEPS
ncbi:MAG: hypothetical protein ABI881_00535 [Betaproteobacteria bacterium]